MYGANQPTVLRFPSSALYLPSDQKLEILPSLLNGAHFLDPMLGVATTTIQLEKSGFILDLRINKRLVRTNPIIPQNGLQGTSRSIDSSITDQHKSIVL
ncbi:unnamed protein product [Didymodactylos carnosus]|uniref:Uncharacterized protein n=1 Tax=Didymodactylos carnosus TaxID=1234261 RepID=A0A8S2CTA7_9BILA|nr:unnamed protein product [Didymodactylos carnosus]CAF3581287.1 unnamed protein product [Didymodactylos carnosus]